MSARNKHGTCAYCGNEKKLTRDHVPPKVLFSQPLPDNMRVVPACAECNESFKKDDEYTRTVVALDVRAASHPDVIGSLSKMMRSLQYPEARGFAQSLGRASTPSTLFGPNGVRLAKLTQNGSRINATGLHIVRGLYYLERGKVIAKDAAIKLAHTTGLTSESREMLDIARVFAALADHRDGVAGRAFSYAAAFGHGVSVWVMLLYDYLFWVSSIDEREESLRGGPLFPEAGFDDE